ncbi:uncharacterized protein LOC119777934 [Cyprinodon tularosa]|uniref:uncharacterized protein LOC119777934 n=1 Tax=Cyprinodon tularosa TaxID=77115 RepID=UPI0018E236C2|nr:uncharacterized protein LOC119777934 [Cyprinodon tularosa]
MVFYSNNGSFRINDLKMSDSGEYKLRMFGKNGKETGSRTGQLCVQAPVSSVQLVHQCLSQGQIKVSCLSEGDSPQYSWTLDGKTLTDSELLSGNNQTNIIVLKPYISGHLFCSVRNQVSSSSNEINIPDCGFIFINCTINGTTIAKWVYKENNTLCVEPTTVPPAGKHHSVGAAASCDGRQDGAQFYGALGGSVELPLENDVSQLRRVDLTKNISVFRGLTNKPTESWKEGRILFYSNNGSFRINDLKMSDSGEYELRMFGKDGKDKGSRTMQLCVQAPVSSVQLVHQCLAQGQIKVSCLSEGDSPQYSWTLDGKTLTDSELLSGNNQTNIIVLKPYISGRLFCSVRNQVSSSSNEINIPDCGFIFINCTINGTTIAKWVYQENNTLCVEPTTVPPTVKHHSVGAAVSCDGRQDGAQYYGALGGSVELPLENDFSQLRRVDLKKNGSVHQCLSQGQIKVSCLSEGDSLQYSWTLDGKTLTDSELLSGNHQTDIIVLKPYISGHLFCSVRNQVSSSSNEINIPDCGE